MAGLAKCSHGYGRLADSCMQGSNQRVCRLCWMDLPALSEVLSTTRGKTYP